MNETGIDWAAKPEPWRWIGPQFRRDCERIAAGEYPKPPDDMKHSRPVTDRWTRKHRPAVPSDPAYQQAKAERAADIASAKASLQIQHELRAAGAPTPKRGPHPMTPTFWTADRVAELTRLWNENLPAKEIAERIGCTRAAVIGKSGRLGLPLHRRSYQAAGSRQEPR